MGATQQIFRKEFNSFFASPAAWLFLGTFLLSNLFIFFWAEAFFARNVADLKPLFEWMPILLVFLVSALTMRSWSEERRSGTLESLLTSPVKPLQLVFGKFTANLALVSLSLMLSAPLAFTVSMMGPMDWGPVIGGYLASLFLAASYIAIGLYMSSRTDNPIVALILTVAVNGAFYIVGSSMLTTLFGHQAGSILKLIGSGSRFDSITRGVLDLRDLFYYISLVGIFLSLNLLSLEKLRWANNKPQTRHKTYYKTAFLIIINLALANVWLNHIGWARIDLTEGKIYSLSEATENYIKQAKEPLLIRGYFSSKSHPLLEPLIPQIENLLKEYEVAGGDKVRVEFVDPHRDQAIEEEAAEKYGIRPVPFRMASRHQAGIVNSYFDVLIAYGDQYENLSFNDLIEVKGGPNGDPEVLLNNPEYAITRSIKKVINSYQAGGNIFADITEPYRFHGYISNDDNLPGELSELKKSLKNVLNEIKGDAGENFTYAFADPEAEGAKLAETLQQEYGFQPQIASLFNPKPFWFYMMLEAKGEKIQIPLPSDLNSAELKRSIQAAVQRTQSGYLKNVAISTPPPPAQMNPYMPPPPGKSYRQLRSALDENVRLVDASLAEGALSTDTDLLLLLSPENIDEKQLFAVDQFLMQGGAVIVATSPYDVNMGRTLDAQKSSSGISEWLEHHGVHIAETMVLDPSNASLPVPVQRQLGPIAVNEIQMMPYPHFPDTRENGLNRNNPITAGLSQLTLNWASPISIHNGKNEKRTVTELIHSSDQSWTSDSLNIMPDYRSYPNTGFKPHSERNSELLAVALSGQFTSFFKGKDSPLLNDEAPPEESDGSTDNETSSDEAEDTEDEDLVYSGVIESSSDSAKLIVLSSNTFASDEVIDLSSQGIGAQYTAAYEFIQNAIDWSLNDRALLDIRSRAQFARTLKPMQLEDQLLWEYINYGLAIAGLIIVWVLRSKAALKRKMYYVKLLEEVK